MKFNFLFSYVYEDERGIQPDVQFCFDLQLPLDFKPTPMDGEVENFKLCTIDEVNQYCSVNVVIVLK